MTSKNYPHRLVKIDRSKYINLTDPDMNTLYFLIDSGEIFLGTLKLGAGFLYVDDEHPKPETGNIGYFYIDRNSLDIYIWNNHDQQYEYIGAAGDNNVSVHTFTEFRDLVLEKLSAGNIATVYSCSTKSALPNIGKENGFYIVKDEDNALYFWEQNTKKYIKLISSDFVTTETFNKYKEGADNQFSNVIDMILNDNVSVTDFNEYKDSTKTLLDKMQGEYVKLSIVETKEDLPSEPDKNTLYVVKEEYTTQGNSFNVTSTNNLYLWESSSSTWLRLTNEVIPDSITVECGSSEIIN